MRPSPPPPPGTLEKKSPEPETRKYRFLTYVFGGGVQVRDHEKPFDSVTPVRGASIRGQLRFWWRACNPSGCETIDALRQREGEIWGTTSQPSKVELAVIAQPPAPQGVAVYEYNPAQRLVTCPGMKDIAYGAFPLQPSREAQQAGANPWVLYDYGTSTFSLRLRYPQGLRDDVETALWAWETFGGLGGRTRRGFGAIARVDGPGAATAADELGKIQQKPRLANVPSLNGSRLRFAARSFPNALEAWKVELGLLQRLRQGRGFGRNDPRPNTQKPAGRSRWPEPDEIRLLTKKSAPMHSQPVVQVSRFPRAVFGMPIVFHFHPGSAAEPGSAGDPNMKPLQLQPVGDERDRFASPLILRPIPDGKGFFRAAALVLSSDVPNCELFAGNSAFPVKWALDANLARQIPALTRNGKAYTDPIQLFLEELEKC
jgi:CRISPR-associated protein Cmr1